MSNYKKFNGIEPYQVTFHLHHSTAVQIEYLCRWVSEGETDNGELANKPRGGIEDIKKALWWADKVDLPILKSEERDDFVKYLAKEIHRKLLGIIDFTFIHNAIYKTLTTCPCVAPKNVEMQGLLNMCLNFESIEVIFK